jgi:predicted XRE-type DNA-binding protein
MTKNKYIGPSFDELLKEEGTLEAAELAAIKKVIAEQVTKEMKKKKISQTEMAKRIGTSRAALMRLLNPENYSVTLLTLYRAAAALGKDLEIRFQ